MKGNPWLLASYLSASNRVRRWTGGSSRRTVALAVAAMLAIAAFIGVAGIVGSRTPTAAWLAAHTVLTAVVAAVHFFLTILRARTRLAAELEQSWLATVPHSRESRRTLCVVRIATSIVPQAAVLIVATGAIALAAGLAAGAIADLLAWLLGGAAIGTFVGGAWRRKPAGERAEDSRYILHLRGTSLAPSLAGLSRWPIAQAVAWHRPENSRVLFILAALSVPLGSSAVLGIAIVAFWTLASYMTALVAATHRVAREASLWLRTTPIGFASFAWALVHRALVHHAIGGALVGATLLAMHAPLAAVMYLWGSWLVIVATAAVIGAAEAYRARASGWRVALCLGAALGIESRAHGWGLSLAVALAAAHVRGALKHVRA